MPITTRQVDNVDRLPPGSGSVDPPPWYAASSHGHLPWQSVVALCVAALLAMLIGYWLFAADVRYWYRYEGGQQIVNTAIVVGGVFTILFLGRKLMLIDASRPRVMFWQLDSQQTVDKVIDVQREYAGNPTRNVRAYTMSPTYHHQIESTDGAALALPEPADTIALTPEIDWLRWVDRAPHLVLAGRTDAGKTTMASAILSERIVAGDELLICDPHWQPGKWFDLPAIASVGAILETLPAIIEEMESRYEQYKTGRATEEFDRLTILIDEVPAIVDRCFELTASGKPKVIDHRWPRFARKLGSEARAVRISVLLLSQSTLVQDMMINVQMRRNFTRIGLGDQARPLLAEEPQSKRRQALFDLLRGQQYPAAMEHHGDYHLLDTSNVQTLSERSVRSLARPWNVSQSPRSAAPADLLSGLLDEPPRTNGRSPAPMRSGLSVLRANAKPPFSAENEGADRQTDRQTEWDHAKKLAVLRAMRQQGITRNSARDRLAGIGQGFDNDDWRDAGMGV